MFNVRACFGPALRVSAVGALFLGAAVIPSSAYAQYVDTTTPYDSGSSYSDPNLGYGIVGPSTGYVDTTTPYYGSGYVDTTTPYTGSGYVDTTTPYTGNGYVDTTTPYTGSGYVDTTTPYYTPSYSYGTDYYTPSYSYGTSYIPSYSYGSSYYPSSYGYSPSYGLSYTPTTYAVGGYSKPAVSGPTYSVSSSQSNNSNTNTNTVSNSGNSSISNSGNSSASTGSITNTFNPVINVNSGAPQQLVQATLPVPSCSVYASNAYNTGYYYNQPISLTWNSQNATSAYISPNVGSVSTQGSQLVYPNGYTTYTMTVYGPGGSATCQTTANYATGYVAPTPIYAATPAPVVAAAVPAVTLTQIPYTGFDFGPVGNSIYWAALLALAAAAAYLLVYFMPGMRLAFASRSTANELDTDEIREVFKSPFAASALSDEAIPSVLGDEHGAGDTVLPSVENRRVTTDSMIVDTSRGAPRIVIARE